MRIRTIAKRSVDILMLVLLPILMMEIQTGQEVQEWLGVGMLALWIAHHAFNAG